MRRYLTDFKLRRIPHQFCDVLVLGSGVAGMRAALAAAEAGAEVVLAAKADLSETNTRYAQGGIATVTGAGDSVASHAADTIEAARGLADEGIVRMVVTQAAERTGELVDWGARFDRRDGELALTREGGHSFPRIIHAGGDATGAEIQRALLARVREHELIRVLAHSFIGDLVDGDDGGIAGAIALLARGGPQVVHAGATVLATGGACAIFRETTNPAVATGDGIAMAYRAGAIVRDLELIQFHPTVLYIAGAARMLVTEAVRGEGAYLVDRDGVRFMVDAHPAAELAPRDVVARAIMRRIGETGASCVYLDCRHLDRDRIFHRFPSIAEAVARFSLDLHRDLIPVHPAAHYTMGGVATDATGATSTPYLFAAGEAACTGLHGANRLGSNSLLEALVFGAIAGESAASAAPGREETRLIMRDDEGDPARAPEIDLLDLGNSLRSLLWRHAGVERDGAGLTEGLAAIRSWERYAQEATFADSEGWELQNQLLLGRLLLRAALEREETRGAHYRRDHPETWARALHCEQEVLPTGEERLELVEKRASTGATSPARDEDS